MITLDLLINGSGLSHFNFSSGTILAVHLLPPGNGSNLGVTIDQLGPTTISVSSSNGAEGKIYIDVQEGLDPVWLAFSVDCRNGGPVTIGFAGSPSVRVEYPSFIHLEYNNGNPPPAPSHHDS